MDINILGYGLMAKQIAAVLYLGGHNIFIWNHKPFDEKELSKQVKLINRSLGSDKIGSFNVVNSLEEISDNLTIESIVEGIEAKISVYEKVRQRITKGYFTNSSSYSPAEIGDDVGGLHFFNPITMKFVEIYESEQAPNNEIELLISSLEAFEFSVVRVKPNRGYIGNYILFHEISSALKLIEKYNYEVTTVSRIYDRLYNGRDIFNIIDLIGIDVVYKILQNLKEEDDSIYLPNCLKEALSKNILGKKNKTSLRGIIEKTTSNLSLSQQECIINE